MAMTIGFIYLGFITIHLITYTITQKRREDEW